MAITIMTTKSLPRLIAFAVDEIHCRVWCPGCARWHTHGYGEAERSGWRHRVAHCGVLGASAPFPDGYLIRLAPAEVEAAIARHAEGETG
jgi:hypothetical protein